MAISPTMSTLNTPRGSITSMRSQQSPMDSGVPGQQGQPQQLQPLADPMMSSYDAFDAATAFVSYTTVTHQNFPASPPGSPRDQVVSSTTSSSNFEQQNPASNFGNYYSPVANMMQVQGATSNQDLPIFNAITMKTEQVRDHY